MSLTSMYFSAQAAWASPPGRRGFRARATGLVAVALTIGLLSGCTPAGPDDHGTTTQGSSVATTSSAPAPGTGSTETATPTETVPTGSTGTVPSGTVVPFGSIVLNSALGKRIGLVAAAGFDPFSKAVAESVETQLLAAGAEVNRCDPGADATLVLGCARRLATQQVDGWITVHIGDLDDALCGAGPQEVPLIAIADPVSCQTAQVGADDYRAGFLTGEELGRASSTTGTTCDYDAVVIVTDGSVRSASSLRSDGIRAGLRHQCPEPLTNEVVLDAATQDIAYQSFTNALTALPDDAEVLVAAVDDGAAMGVAAAIPAARAAHITLASIGADQRARCEIVANPQWIGDAALFPDRYGEVAVPALLDALRGQEIPPSMYVETTFVTADSLDNFYDINDCPGQ